MKKYLFLLLFVLCCGYMFSQVYVPYRKGDKFGISDESGKIIIQPTYNYTELQDDNNILLVKEENLREKKSFFSDGKLLLKDTDYNYFKKTDHFVIATNIYDFERNSDLYSIDGKKLLDGTQKKISVIFEPKNSANGTVFLTESKNGSTLFLLENTKLKKRKEYFSNAEVIDMERSSNRENYSIVYKLNNETAVNKITLNFKDGVLVNTDTSPTVWNKSSNYDRNEMYTTVQEPMKMPDEKPQVPQTSGDILDYKFVSRVQDRANRFPLSFDNKKFDPTYSYLKKVNGKLGYFLVRKNKFAIEPKYDDIILSDGRGALNEGFVLKTGNSYQFLVLEDNGNVEFLTPKFEMFPVFIRRDFGRKGFQLILLYDKDGRFFCYANSEGKIYYEP